MAHRVILYKMTSDPIKFTKNKNMIKETSCEFKSPIDVVNPVLRIKGYYADCNYVYVQYFKRHYFVTKVVGLNDDVVELTCHSDVLSNNNIKDLTTTVERQEFKRNTSLIDKELLLQANTNLVGRNFGDSVCGESNYNTYITVSGGGRA